MKGPTGLVDDGFATVARACEFLGLSRATLYKLMDTQGLQYAKFGKSRRLPWRALREYAERCLVVA
jgi:excisionase family DNA binding protein